MSRFEVIKHQKRNKVILNNKEFIIEKHVYNKQQKYIDTAVKAFLVCGFICEALWYFKIIKMYVFIPLVIAGLLAVLSSCFLPLPKDVNSFLVSVNEDK